VAGVEAVPSAVVLVAAVIAAATDLWKFRVPNLLTLPLMASGVVFHTVAGGLDGLTASLIGMVFGFGILFLFYLMGGYGGADVKLLAAVGAWLGVTATFYVFLISSLAGGVYALLLILLYGKLGETWTRLQVVWFRLAALGRHLGADDGGTVEAGRIDRRRAVPIAAMMCLGVIATLIWQLWQAKQP
jgi:prepilin peptidase CpaA